MKISVIHNVFKENPLIRQCVILNLMALDSAGVEYQYIVFNDKGDENIKKQVEDLPVTYHYSDYNFGHKMCTGGWYGAIPLLEGDLVHNTGQDDIHTEQFYRTSLNMFSQTDCDMVFSNGFKVREDASLIPEGLLPFQDISYVNPRSVLSQLLGMEGNKSTRCWNFVAAPGVIYKKKLHDEIGPPDVDNFRGAADQEYWYRMLFHEKKLQYIKYPSWLYTVSQYSAALEVIDGKENLSELNPQYIDKIQSTYERMLNEIEE